MERRPKLDAGISEWTVILWEQDVCLPNHVYHNLHGLRLLVVEKCWLVLGTGLSRQVLAVDAVCHSYHKREISKYQMTLSAREDPIR